MKAGKNPGRYETNGTTVYTGSLLTKQNPSFPVHKLLLGFYWSVS